MNLCKVHFNTNVTINKKILKLICSLNYENKGDVLDFEYGFILFNPYTTMDELDNNLNTLFKSDIRNIVHQGAL